MARLNVNPTRMELKKLKARLATAVRGHKLLKDKSDEMVRRFSLIIRENKRLRDEVEEELSQTLRLFSVARSVTPAYRAETAFSMPSVGEKGGDPSPQNARAGRNGKDGAYARGGDRAQQTPRKRAGIRYDTSARRNDKIYKEQARRKRARRRYSAYESKKQSLI